MSINRRSGSLILDVANEVASDVRSQHPGVQILRPGTEAAGEVTAALFDTWADELDWLVAQVLAQIHQGRSLDQIAVLCRTNDYVRMVGQALRDAGIPTAAASLGSVLHLPEVVEVLSLLRVLETADNGALVRLLTGPQWRIGPSDLALLGARARELVGSSDDGEPDFQQALQQAVADVDPVDVVSLLEAVYDPGPAISDEARSRLREFTAELDAMRPALPRGGGGRAPRGGDQRARGGGPAGAERRVAHRRARGPVRRHRRLPQCPRRPFGGSVPAVAELRHPTRRDP